MLKTLLSLYHKLPKRELSELAILASVFVIAYLFINVVHFRLFEVRVILFASLFDLVVATALVFGAYSVFRAKARVLSGLNIFLAALALNLGAIIYAIMGPTVIDRSLSIYIVEKLQQRGGAIREDAFDEIFVKEYLPEFRLMDVRLTEQLTSGTIEINDGCAYLTAKGEAIANFSRFYRRNMLPRRRVLLSEVTDQLTDPFRDSKKVVDTDCNAAL